MQIVTGELPGCEAVVKKSEYCRLSVALPSTAAHSIRGAQRAGVFQELVDAAGPASRGTS